MFASKRLRCSLCIGLLGLGLASTACGGHTRPVQAATTTSAAAQVAAQGSVTRDALPAGTTLTVRTIDPISSETSQEGSKFAATLVSGPTTETGEPVIPDGAKVYGRVTESRGGGAAKRPRLMVELSEVQAPARMVSIATNAAGAEGDRDGAIKKIGGATLLGLSVGEAGVKASGAAATAGAVAVVSGGNQIVIKPGTLIEFRLAQPVQLR